METRGEDVRTETDRIVLNEFHERVAAADRYAWHSAAWVTCVTHRADGQARNRLAAR